MNGKELSKNQYTAQYFSPLGALTLACDDEAVTGLWFNGQKNYGSGLTGETKKEKHPLLTDMKRWLDIYFSGKKPDFLPPLRYGSTPFRRLTGDIMLTIPYGETITYGEIAARAAKIMGVEKMSAQAVGGAVGHNPIALMIPCHRVVGANGSLTGYAGGVERKARLLELEGVDRAQLFIKRENPGKRNLIRENHGLSDKSPKRER